jgi:integrase
MTTVHHVHTQLGKLLHDAERKGLVMRNAARLADAPSFAVARDRALNMNVSTPDELRRFLEFSEDYRAGPTLHLAAMTGMRRGEVVALSWDSVDLAHSTLKVRAAATFLKGEETIDVPKTKRSRRTIDLDQRTASVLKQHRAAQREELFMVGVTAPTDDRVSSSHARLAPARCRCERQGRERTPWSLVGELHARHVRSRDAGPAERGRRGRRGVSQGVPALSSRADASSSSMTRRGMKMRR